VKLNERSVEVSYRVVDGGVAQRTTAGVLGRSERG